MKLSLGSKITTLFSIGLAMVTAILISLFSGEVHHRYCDLFIERGKSTVDELLIKTDKLLQLGLYPHELMGYEEMLNGAMSNTEGIVYLAFLDANGDHYFEAGSVPIDLSQRRYFQEKPISLSDKNEFIIQSSLPKSSRNGGSIVAILDRKLVEQKTVEFVKTTLSYALLASFIAILIAILYLRFNLGGPLNRLVSRIQRVDLREVEPQHDQLSERPDEIGVVARTFDAMLKRLVLNQAHLAKTNAELTALTHELEDRVEQRTRELEKVNKQLQSLAHIDMLTGLLNRHCLEEVLSVRFENAKRNKHRFAILMMDLDRFKAINDKFGHVAGDKALAVIGERIRSALRYGDRVFRYGGDEFVFILEDYADSQALHTMINKIQKVILQPVVYEGNELDFGLSIGVACTDCCNASTAEQLIVKADQAMYQAKRDNCIYVLAKDNLADPQQ